MFRTKEAIYVISGIERKIEFNEIFQKKVIKGLNQELRQGLIDGWYITGEAFNCNLGDPNFFKYFMCRKMKTQASKILSVANVWR